MKKYLILIISALAAAFILLIFPTADDSGIYDSALRLHVLAESDAEEDQALKLKVRDAVLENVGVLIRNCNDFDSAYGIISENLSSITDAAQKAVYDSGYNYTVTPELGKEHYPTRNYDGVSLPAGTYCSLKIKIGSAQGKNWWCVLFPPLCTASAENRDEALAVGFTSGQVRLITSSGKTAPAACRYRIKFRFLEILGEMFG